MHVEFSASTNMQGSRVAEVFNVAELTGCTDEQIRQMPAVEFDDMLSDEWRSWLLSVTDGGWSVVENANLTTGCTRLEYKRVNRKVRRLVRKRR